MNTDNYYMIKVAAIWLVVESQTNLVVGNHLDKSDAAGLCDFLNGGGGFDGFTPTFMLKQIVTEDYVFSVEDDD